MKIIKYLIVFLLGLAVGAFAFYQIISFVKNAEPLGYRLDYSLSKVTYSRYSDSVNNFTFLFGNTFDLDESSESAKKYGKTFLVGFKDKTDSRVGCDVRRENQALDLSQSTESLTQSLASQFGQGGEGVKILRAAKVETGQGLPAFQLNFNFLDPLGAVTTINQVVVPQKSGTYFLICGAGTAYFDKFAKDFSTFFNSFGFTGS